MKKGGNIKVLTSEELKFFNENYEITFDEKATMVFVRSLIVNRVVVHPRGEPFSVYGKDRIIKISPYAIDYVCNNLDKGYSVFDVQNAINLLLVSYRQPSYEDINNQLLRMTH